jgi:polysaccharide export outer membrane protein
MLGISALWLFLAVQAVAQQAAPTSGVPRIEHRAVGCFVRDRFAEISASIEPAEGLRRVRLYFRTPRDPDFLFVEMTTSDKGFVGVLPRPRENATSVTYFLEASSEGGVSRSGVVSAPVVAGARACERGLPAADAGKLDSLVIYTLGAATTLPAGFNGVAEVRPAPRVAAGSSPASVNPTPTPAAPSPTTPTAPARLAPAPTPPPAATPQAATPSPVDSPPSRAPTGAPEYALGKDDLVRVTVYGHDDLAQTLVIQPDGTFNFPLIGRVQAEGLTPRELEQRLTQSLGKGFVRAPQVTVTVQEYRSKTVFVVGEVARPGPYPLSGSLSIMEVLAKAGATGGVGAEVVIVRPSGPVIGPVLPEASGNSEILRVNLFDIQMGQLSKNVQLRSNDTVFVSAAKVFVTGEVRSPGSFPYQPGITVRQAISMAGGLSPDGSSSRLQVVRSAGSKTTRSKLGIDDLVRPGDTIVVRAKLF